MSALNKEHHVDWGSEDDPKLLGLIERNPATSQIWSANNQRRRPNDSGTVLRCWKRAELEVDNRFSFRAAPRVWKWKWKWMWRGSECERQKSGHWTCARVRANSFSIS